MPIEQSTTRRTRLLLRGAMAVYLLALGWLVFDGADDAESVTGIVAVLAEVLHARGVPLEIGYTVFEFAANIALFVPFGVLLTLNAPLWHPLLSTATGLALSCSIELVQTALPSRLAAPSDLLANALGTALGVVLVHAASVWRHRAGTR